MAWYDYILGVAAQGQYPDMSYTPPGAPAEATTTTAITPEQQAAFSPMSSPAIMQAANPFVEDRYRETFNAAAGMADTGRENQATVDQRLMTGFQAPERFTPTAVTAEAPRANTAQSGAAYDSATDYLRQTNQSRANQQSIFDTASQWAQGNMPSVGKSMAEQAGVEAERAFGTAGSQANQAYGSAAASAAQAYGMTASNAAQAYQDALATQRFATEQAGRTAARQTGDAASDAITRQAALTSMARGGNIGMALRTGLQGAAAQSQQANVQGARLMGDANAQAAFNAAAGQRSAQTAAAQQALATQNAALQSNLATQGTQERAGFNAAAALQAGQLQAAQIGSAEQQASLALAAGQANAMRGSDIGATGAATNLGGLALGSDQMINAMAQQNAQRAFDAGTFNATMGFNAAGLNAQTGLAYDQLNSGNLNAVANRGMQGQQFGIGTQANMAGQATQQQYQMAVQEIMGNQQLAQMFVGLDEANKQRMLDAWIGRQGIATERRGQNMGIAGSGVGAAGAAVGALAMMSDKRAKKAVKKTSAPDFSKAGSYSYEYKNPKADGAAPGRHSGPMAQELPKDMLKRGDDGLLRVDIGRLALNLASAMGDVQRRLGAA